MPPPPPPPPPPPLLADTGGFRFSNTRPETLRTAAALLRDVATLSGGAATVKLPLLSGAVADYTVVASDLSGTAAATSATLTFGDNVTTVTLAGTSTNNVAWAVIKRGLAM